MVAASKQKLRDFFLVKMDQPSNRANNQGNGEATADQLIFNVTKEVIAGAKL
jgi:hypothetical protein